MPGACSRIEKQIINRSLRCGRHIHRTASRQRSSKNDLTQYNFLIAPFYESESNCNCISMNCGDERVIKSSGGNIMLQTKNAFSSFSVNDLQRAKQFYGQTLGLKLSESEMGLEIHPGD